MSLFDNNLALVGLGIEDDSPGPGTSTALPDGIHLRWLFKRERGFPWHGYYLLRRQAASGWHRAFDFKRTIGNDLQKLLDSFDDGNRGAVYVPLSWPSDHRADPLVVVGIEGAEAESFFQKVGTAEENSSGRLTIDSVINASDLDVFPLFSPQQLGPTKEYDLYGLSLHESARLQLQSPPLKRYRRVRIRFGFLQDDSFNIFARQGGETVQRKSISGNKGNIRTVELNSDRRPFSILTFSRADAVVLDFEVVFTLGSEEWALADTLRRLPQPIRLPLTHPDYPAGLGAEKPSEARRTASMRTFVQGRSFPHRTPTQDVPAQGTVEVTEDSPFVRGFGTDWDDTIEGHVLETDLDEIPHVIMRVLDSDRLVLARAYTGPSHAQASYSINPDPFGQLYDALGLLVEGGPAAAPMAGRFLRPNYHPGGTALVQRGSTRVAGQGTNWSFAMEGLHLHCLRDQGTLRFTPGSNVVEGVGTNWTSRSFLPLANVFFSGLPGSLLEIDGHSRPYIVTHVVGDERLRVHQPVAGGEHDGDTRPGTAASQTADFRLLDRQSYRIDRVDTAAELHLNRPYRGRSRETEYVIRVPGSMEEAESEVKMPDQRLLDVITMGSLSPMIAQALGLHVVDRPPKTDDSGELLAYDYLLIADYEGFFQNQSVAAWVNSDQGRAWLLGADDSEPDLDAAITYDHRIEPAPPPAPPEAPRAYRLRDAARLLPRTGQPHEAPIKALSGLTWDGPSQAPPGEAPILYHVWRQFLGQGDAPALSQPDDPANYFQLTRPLPGNPPGSPGPVVVAQTPSTFDLPPRPSDWPRDLRYLDMVSRYGWYSYRISSVDLFGRYGPLSEAAPWWRHGFFTHGEPPTQLHPFAVNIADEAAPPRPTAVEAQVLDPADPYIQRGSAVAAWRSALPEDQREALAGLRVRWSWTQGQMQQAPDATHFQICYHPHRLNVLTGRVTQVDADGPDHVFVTTDVSISASPWHLKGAYLRVGSHSYRIVRSHQAQSDPLRVRVETLGPDGLRPKDGERFALALTRDLDRRFHTDFGESAAWDDPNFHRVPVDAFASEHLKPRFDAAGQPLSGAGASAQGAFLTLPSDIDLSTVRPGLDHVHLPDDASKKYYRIAQIQPPQQPGQGSQLWLAETPQVSISSVQWTIGIYERRYEVLLPEAADADGFDLRLTPSATEPVAYGHVGVTAHDVRGHSSPVSAPAKVYRVHHTAPDAPPPLGDVTDTDNVYATAADYHGRSYHTVTWPAKEGHGVHVFRALDDAVFARDRAIRATRVALDPAGTPRHHPYFPEGMAADRREAVANQLNAIAGSSDYAALDIDALRVLRCLPGNEIVVVPDDAALQARRDGLAGRDWQLRRTRGRLAPDDDVIPQAWSAADRQAVADTLNALDPAAPDAYRGLSNRALRVLASLPGHAAAFTQITTQPVTAPDESYRDTLPGRSHNRFFFRVAYVDAGQNQSALSPSGPPIHLPDVVAPQAPTVTAVQGGDRRAILRWLSNREPDLVEYRIYRVAARDAARDTRLMKQIAAVAETNPDPRSRPAERTWVDEPLHGVRTFYYRLVAVDRAGNVSDASPPVAGAAYDYSPPPKPTWTRAEWVRLGDHGAERPWNGSGTPAVALFFTCSEPNIAALVQRREPEGWHAVTSWRKDPAESSGGVFEYRIYDRSADPTRSQTYRIKLVSGAGIELVDDTTRTVGAP